MAIQTEISRIQTAKINLKAAIEAKGVEIPSDELISDYFEYVEDIQTAEDLQNLIERDITYINIPRGTTTIGANAFTNCSQLVTVVMPSSVTSIGSGAFNLCSSLVTCELSPNLTIIGGSAFQNCTALTTVDIPASVTEIGGSGYYGCTSLTTVTVRATTPPPTTLYTFVNCPNLAHIYVPIESVEAYKAASGWSTYASKIEAIPSAE